MGRAPCCTKVGLHRGPWTPKEDALLTEYIQAHGEGHWKYLPKKAGLLRCGKSCRLRWMNYLRPDIKRGNITPDEDDLIIRLHSLLGNRWSLIAGRLPGRTDNEIKNYWNTHLSKKLRGQGRTHRNTHKKSSDPAQELKKQRNNSKNKNRKKHNHIMQKAIHAEAEKPKIHLPKASRVTSFSLPRIESFEYNTVVSGSSSHAEAVDVPWSSGNTSTNIVKDGDVNGVGFFIGDDHHDDLFHGSDLECQSHIPTADSTLEKLYEEYLQLLKTEEEDQRQLDSFAESLLI
ncbi:hypothetical protein L1049_013558 [Liquidambar formosana]|uniref:Uncharacterized protein n=1 Tax=Liquidambar formosana TaxID=63359 RepID=A0AAP0RPG7_LIQFO